MFGRAASCSGKEAFDDPAVARKVASRWRKRAKHRGRTERQDRTPAEVYRCTHCGKYHLGHALPAP